MTHKKKNHQEKLARCWKFSANKCEFGEDECWFSHVSSNIEEPKTIVCNLCDNIFYTMSNLLHHKKLKHIGSVKTCKNSLNNECRFGAKKCWFLHEEETILGESQNKGVTEQIFSMMETFTNKIMELENEI